ncbi:MAG: fumarylacetoacetate hydrolase family protein [Chloroflexi bacterium]|nr:fumarylacetoacetate hydrolase family protein [Chloroflexota bacterium]
MHMIYLTMHETFIGPRWALQGKYLPEGFNLALLLTMPRSAIAALLAALPHDDPAEEPLLPPIEADQEVWAAGVTYLRSRDARKVESTVGDVYQMVYEADRPELFFKAIGWRCVGADTPVRIRADSAWNVPEPELVLVMNQSREIVGFTLGNDMSSRDIEGKNPLYLPQAKIYNGSCALGPGIVIAAPDEFRSLPIRIEIERNGQVVFKGETSLTQMKRRFEELVDYLFKETEFPEGVFLMTGTGIVPPDTFTLQVEDTVRVSTTLSDGQVLTLENEVL